MVGMSQVWERIFVVAARFCAWLIAGVPLAAAVLLIVAAIAGQRPAQGLSLLFPLFTQLAVTLLIAALATVIGATLGIGSALFSHEQARPRVARAVRLHAKFLAAVPAVVFGWFGVILLSAQPAAGSAAVLAVAILVVALATLPSAYILAVRCVRALPLELREAAAALGANARQTTAHVILPASLRRFAGIYAAVFSLALVESAAVSIVFLYAVRLGYQIAQFSLGAVLLAQPTAMRTIDAGVAVAAICVFALSTLARASAARRIGELEWV